MGGGTVQKSSAATSQSDSEPEEDLDDEDFGDSDDPVDASEVIKALTDKVEALIDGQAALVKSINALVAKSEEDAGFRKSIGEGLIGVLEGIERIAESPLPRKGTSTLDGTGIQKGNLGAGSTVRKHRQLTVGDKNELTDIITKATEQGELSHIDSGRLETQINKSIRDPNFQIDPDLLRFLEKKMPKPAAA